MISSDFWGRRADGAATRGLLFYNHGLALVGIPLPTIVASTIISILCFIGYLTIFGRIVVRKTVVYLGKITMVHAVGQIVRILAGGRLPD